MKIQVEVIDEVIQFKHVPGLKNGRYEVTINNLETKTTQQLRALYLWMTHIANRLNTENVSTTQILRPDIQWDMEKVKYMFVKPVIAMLYQKKSIANLGKADFDQIIDVVTKSFGQRGIALPPFPTMEGKENR